MRAFLISVTQRSKRKETFLPCHIQCMNNLISTLKSPLFQLKKNYIHCLGITNISF